LKQEKSQSTLVRRVAPGTVVASETNSLYSIVRAIAELIAEHRSTMGAIRQRWQRVSKPRREIARNAHESNLVLEEMQAEVNDIVLRARAGLTIHRYAAKGAEPPVRQFVSKGPRGASDGVAAKQRMRRVGRKQRLNIRRHMAHDTSTIASITMDVRRIERTIARLSGVHTYILSNIKQQPKRKEHRRQPRIRRHVVRSTPSREATFRQSIISTRQRGSRPRRIRYINNLSIQRHPTYPVRQQRSAKFRRISQSRPRGSIEPRLQKKVKLLQTVSEWLAGGAAKETAARSAGRVRRRPFGSRMVEVGEGAGDEIRWEGNGDR
jgi:hypothetical protein